MNISTCRLCVYFEDPFWVGVFERVEDGKLSVAKVTFGAEPKDYEVYHYLLHNFYRLRFSNAIEADIKETPKNPKRALRQAKKQTENVGIGTKSQQALKLQQEENKVERKAYSKEQKEAEKQRQFDIKQLKRKEKHRGR